MKIFKKKKSFKKEFKRQLRMAILAAIGFTIAFSWKEAIFNTFQNFVSRFLDISPTHYLSQNYTALVITLAGVLIIFFTSRLLRD
jgi:TRAP-type C4-dicarboxylate transport system permease small subunit